MIKLWVIRYFLVIFLPSAMIWHLMKSCGNAILTTRPITNISFEQHAYNNCLGLLSTDFLISILEYPPLLADLSFDYYKYHSLGIPSKLDSDGLEFPFHRIDQVSGKYSWINCNILRYEAEDIEECVNERGGKLKLFFIGDSRTRQLFEAHLLEMEMLPMAVQGERVIIKDGKPKLILNSAELQNNSRVQFKYFSTLNSKDNFRNQPKSMKKHLENISKMAVDSFPDLIVLSFIQWGVLLSAERTLKGFDSGMTQMTEVAIFLKHLAPILIKRGAKIIWLLVDDIKKYSFNHNQGYIMEWYNQIVLHHLRTLAKDGLVYIWDTGFPVSLKVFEECEVRESKGFFSYFRIDNNTDQDVRWKCSDMSHVGPQGTRVHIQFLYNFVCNKYLRKWQNSTNVCCVSN